MPLTLTPIWPTDFAGAFNTSENTVAEKFCVSQSSKHRTFSETLNIHVQEQPHIQISCYQLIQTELHKKKNFKTGISLLVQDRGKEKAAWRL